MGKHVTIRIAILLLFLWKMICAHVHISKGTEGHTPQEQGVSLGVGLWRILFYFSLAYVKFLLLCNKYYWVMC